MAHHKMNNLPNETLYAIFRLLPISDLTVIWHVSRRFRSLANSVGKAQKWRITFKDYTYLILIFGPKYLIRIEKMWFRNSWPIEQYDRLVSFDTAMINAVGHLYGINYLCNRYYPSYHEDRRGHILWLFHYLAGKYNLLPRTIYDRPGFCPDLPKELKANLSPFMGIILSDTYYDPMIFLYNISNYSANINAFADYVYNDPWGQLLFKAASYCRKETFEALPDALLHMIKKDIRDINPGLGLIQYCEKHDLQLLNKICGVLKFVPKNINLFRYLGPRVQRKEEEWLEDLQTYFRELLIYKNISKIKPDMVEAIEVLHIDIGINWQNILILIGKTLLAKPPKLDLEKKFINYLLSILLEKGIKPPCQKR